MSRRGEIPPQIIKLLPMLASDKDGEVVATARAIGRTLKGNGQDFHDLVAALTTPSNPSRSWHSNSGNSPDYVRVRWAWEQGAAWLPAKDVVFLNTLGSRCRWGGTPSPAQAEWLADIIARIEARCAA